MRPVVFLILLLASLNIGQAQNLFRSVRVSKDTWEVTFPEKGSRYHIKIDDFSRGSSGYLQRLRLKKTEKLRLIDKHFVMEITPAEIDGETGIEIVTTYRDRLTGEKKIKEAFERNHQAGDVKQVD